MQSCDRQVTSCVSHAKPYIWHAERKYKKAQQRKRKAVFGSIMKTLLGDSMIKHHIHEQECMPLLGTNILTAALHIL